MTGQNISHYRILEKIGEGGMGVVYKAEDTRLRRIVALKFLPQHLSDDEEVRRRFLHEAQAAASLNHPNICVIHEVDEECNFLAMEYLEGETVSAKLKRRPLPLNEALNIATQAAKGLQAAHEKGVVHRDVKSANLMLSAHGQVKVMDFGLAQIGGQTRITRTGSSLGTPAYMSPEQYRGETVDKRTDIWSLGIVLYEMAAGKLPFSGDSEAALMYSVLNQEAEPLTAVRTDVPVGLDRMARKALAKDRERRYQHVEDLLVDLQAAQKAPGAAQDSRRWKPLAVTAVVLAVMAAGIVAWRQRVRNVRESALQQAADLYNAGQSIPAYRLARQLEAEMPGDPRVGRLWDQVGYPFSLRTEPAGADVHIKELAKPESAWIHLGKTPLVSVRVPLETNLRWRVTLEGHEEVERTGFQHFIPSELKLAKLGASPPEMVFVPGGDVVVNQQGARLEDFWLDKYEVSNRQFKDFVDAGGYRDKRFWKQPFEENGKQISWERAVTRFVDATGRPGPAPWELGSFPEGKADYPVSGVSWYEAAAFAEFAGKELPTIFHWTRAGVDGTSGDILPVSNYGGKGAAPRGRYQGVSRFGAYDMAGNVGEWCWNRSGSRRYALVGAWSDPSYMFRQIDAQSPFQRSETVGFRCAKYPAPPSPESTQAVEIAVRDYSKEKPATEEVFRVYRGLYSYDRGPLDAKVEQVDDSDPIWRVERASFNAAYGNERVIAYLYLPKGAARPYQTVIHFPGSYAYNLPQINNLTLLYARYFGQSGRALVIPIFQGTYERRSKIVQSGQYFNRDRVIQWSKDLGRSIDYLETRQDIDLEKLAYHGFSMGSGMALPLLAVEGRFKTAILLAGGLYRSRPLPEIDPIHFVPRVRIPVLMINGREDFLYPYGESQLPLFRFLGSPPSDKRHVVVDSGHVVPRNVMIKESLDWLDKYLGPVK